MKLFRTTLLLTLFLTILSYESVKAQVEFGKNDTLMVQAIVVDGDTIPFAYLPMVNIYSQRIFKSKRAQVKYTKLRRDVIKVWPYAKLAGEKFKQLEKELAMTNDKRVQKALVEKTEKEIMQKFEAELKKLTVSQGKILIKLIDRQTGNTSYRVLQDLKGNLNAFFWQSLARLFGSNLKSHYDPFGEDAEIEKIIVSIQ
ncbi:MAG: DUF4294 domain-containing protein [bacterium]|jgi:hypothetical protein